jgi:hypothetical protein
MNVYKRKHRFSMSGRVSRFEALNGHAAEDSSHAHLPLDLIHLISSSQYHAVPVTSFQCARFNHNRKCLPCNTRQYHYMGSWGLRFSGDEYWGHICKGPVASRAMHVWRTIEERSCNQSSSGKVVNITHSECVSVALVIQHAMRMRHIVTCDLLGTKEFLQII